MAVDESAAWHASKCLKEKHCKCCFVKLHYSREKSCL